MDIGRQVLSAAACLSSLHPAPMTGRGRLLLPTGVLASQDLRACQQLPVELELGDEFVFHSIFACPVSK